ncbi:MAG TPA: ABC transporter permease [Acidimicrobiales bacterium]|nr:ABC transporter permease [Acidimicrobiales bacterium]
MASNTTLRVVEHHFTVYRSTWRGSLVSSFLAPVLYLAAMGIGLGSLIHAPARTSHLGGLSYLAFVGPGLLAASAMQIASSESTFPVMAGIKWLRTWHGMLATPIRVRDLVNGEFVWIMFRVALAAVAYLIVLTLFGIATGPMALLAVPAAVLCGMAFSTPIAAFAATQETDQGFVLIFRLGVMPLFLFSGTFFPVSQLPRVLQPVARVTPLWHGVELTRAFVLDRVDWVGVVVHVAYLLAWVLVGWAIARRTFERRLAQ